MSVFKILSNLAFSLIKAPPESFKNISGRCILIEKGKKRRKGVVRFQKRGFRPLINYAIIKDIIK